MLLCNISRWTTKQLSVKNVDNPYTLTCSFHLICQIRAALTHSRVKKCLREPTCCCSIWVSKALARQVSKCLSGSHEFHYDGNIHRVEGALSNTTRADLTQEGLTGMTRYIWYIWHFLYIYCISQGNWSRPAHLQRQNGWCWMHFIVVSNVWCTSSRANKAESALFLVLCA